MLRIGDDAIVGNLHADILTFPDGTSLSTAGGGGGGGYGATELGDSNNMGTEVVHLKTGSKVNNINIANVYEVSQVNTKLGTHNGSQGTTAVNIKSDSQIGGDQIETQLTFQNSALNTSTYGSLVRMSNNVMYTPPHMTFVGLTDTPANFGSNGQVLTNSNGSLAWTTPASGGSSGGFATIEGQSIGNANISARTSNLAPSTVFRLGNRLYFSTGNDD